MRLKRSFGLLFLLLALAAALPVLAYDFHSWRSDGTYTKNTSTGQQSSNQAFNLYEQFLDAGSSSISLYWVGELQQTGGLYPPTTDPDDAAFGLTGPTLPITAPLHDNRQQDRDVDWATWPVVTQKLVVAVPPQPPRPLFTPNVPFAMSPVVVDLDNGFGTADHFLASVSVEPDQVPPAVSMKEQTLNVYYPENAKGLPGNDSSLPPGVRGIVKPYWFRGSQTNPGLRIRDLEPVRGSLSNSDPGVGVVTQPPIFARVPTVYRNAAGAVVNELLPVVYLVVGTGENGDFARVICLALRRPAGMTGPDWAPDVNAATPPTSFPPIDINALSTDITDYFNPVNAGGGAVMWSYTVKLRTDLMLGSNVPSPVAGISFANIGTSADPKPRLFVTTADGQIICLNAQGADQATFSEDGDARISVLNSAAVDNPETEWVYETPIRQPLAPVAPAAPIVTGLPSAPVFYYGMAPAVARVPLTNLFSSTGPGATTVARAMASGQMSPNATDGWEVSEFAVFTADAYGHFRAFEAPGNTQFAAMGGQRSQPTPLPRWLDTPYIPNTAMPPPTFRLDPQGNAERYITPPVVYQGATPLRNDNGALLSGSTDVGFDDEVIFTSERATVNIFDAIGDLTVGGASNGQPTGTTRLRYSFPTDDTAALPATVNEEPRAWPRDVPDDSVTPAIVPAPANDPDLIRRQKGPGLAYNTLFSRSAMAASLGANVNPNGQNPNLEVGDDHVFVPYLSEITGPLPYGGTFNPPANTRAFYEYVGSLKPYGFVQASRPILQLTRVRVTIAGTQYTVPLDRLRVGTIKNSGFPSTAVATIIGSTSQNGANPNFDASVPAPDDTVYFAATSWFDDATSAYVQMPIGAPVELTYDTETSIANSAAVSVTETLGYPSCYRIVPTNPADPTITAIVRGRASLTDRNARLEQHRVRPSPGMGMGVQMQHEEPALINDILFGGYGFRQPSMFASGSVGTAGNLLAPSWFRGRIISLSHSLRTLRVILGSFDPRLDPNIRTTFAVGNPERNYGPKAELGLRDFTYDPGVFFFDPPGMGMGMPPGLTSVNDMPLISDVGGSVTIIDGWVYVTHRNGHIRGYANQGGGGAGVINANPPLLQLDVVQPPSGGNLVKSPYRDATDPNRGIHISFNPLVRNDPTNTAHYSDLSPLSVDQPLLLEWGQTFWMVVDFGPSNEVAQPNTGDANLPPTTMTAGDDIDPQILDPANTITAQIRSPNGAVQAQTGQTRGVPVRVVNNRVVAVVEVFAGAPSFTNPLTPGTPLLWEKDSANFTGEVTYELQVVQQGVRWRWPVYTADPMNMNRGLPDPAKEHYWETERPTGASRFPTTAGQTAGAPNWTWGSEWAPLVSYNNPIMLAADPDGNPTLGAAAIFDPAAPPGTPRTTIGAVAQYNGRNDPGRKNGDEYAQPSVDGSRSGSGVPIVPVIGLGFINQGGSVISKQLLYADHGKASPTGTTQFPEMAKLRVGDRSHLALGGRALMLRVQPAPLTKMGVGALYGRTASGDGSLANLRPENLAPAGSFEQNVAAFDDGPHGMYSSIPGARLAVTKQGTNLDLTQSPIQVAGRNTVGLPDPRFPFPPAPPPAGANSMEQISVQVDVPQFTADDVYSTRWRSAGPNGALPAHVSAGGSRFNPFFPGNNPEASRGFWDHAERLSRPAGAGPAPAPGEEQPSPYPDPNPNYDDRVRRVVVFNDANNNGVLDLAPTYREAYRTFAVQVMVKPELKLEAQQQQIDFANLWHGKKQPGMGAGAAEIQEWQRMAQLAASAVPTDRAAAQFWGGFWRPFNLINTGNVNLAYVKPEVAYQILGSGPQLIGIPSEGNDPWKALRLINGLTGAPNPLTDPWQIFLRTSFDDQLLPDAATAYGNASRGVWLQKAQPGAAQGGAVAFADPTAPIGNAIERDPTNGGVARETFITMNIPTGTPLGNYAGSIRFYNDRAVTLVENLNLPLGFLYCTPEALQPGPPPPAQQNGTLDRLAAPNLGEPIEPMTDPPFRIKTKVIENLVHGRHQTVTAPADLDRRFMPAAAPDISSANGNVQRLLLGYISNRRGQGAALGSVQPNVYDLYATSLLMDTGRGLFPFDELPRDRGPWTDLTGTLGWTQVTAVPNIGMQILKPNMTRDTAAGGTTVAAWTQRTGRGGGNDEYRVFYQPITAAAPIQLQPNGQPPDINIPRQGVRMFPVGSLLNGAGGVWMSLYSLGQGLNRSISYTYTPDINNGNAWVLERPLATPKGLSSVTDPHVFTTPPLTRVQPIAAQPSQPPYLLSENTTLPEMAWMAFTGSHMQLARTDIYLSRYRIPALLQAGSRTSPDLAARLQDFARVGFPRTENDVLRANPERTRFVSSGADFLVAAHSRVQMFIGRPDLPPAAPGSTGTPFDLIGLQVGLDTNTGEIVFPIDPLVIALAPPANQPRLQQVRIYVDKNSGVFRISHDSRTVAGLLTGALGPNSPDPILTANFTAATLRITKGDIPANDAVVIPTLSQGGIPVMDASWYRQQIDGGGAKWAAGTPVAGIADRLWVLWRRAAGANSGGATCYMKTLRPGIRVRAGAIQGIQTSELQTAIGGTGVTPEEVNPQIGQIYFPQSYEGQQVDVSYRDPSGQVRVERHYIGWQDETGERPVPMDTSVNEGSLDGFASYEDVGMTPFGGAALGQVRHLEKVWLFWSSTRGTGGDLMYATIAPRIGPEANIGNTATFFANNAARFPGMSPNAVRQAMAAAAATERRKPYVIPPMYRRGPYVPLTGVAGRRSGR